VQKFPELVVVNVDVLYPSTTTLGELPKDCCPEESVTLFRATFDGEEEATNIHHTNLYTE